MTDRTKLSDFEKGKIVAYKDCGLSNRKIAIKLGRSHTTVIKFLKKFEETSCYSRKKGSGRKRKTSERYFFLYVERE